MIPISTIKKYGLKYLINKVERHIISSTNRKKAVLRVQTGSSEFEWLMKNLSIYEIEIDPENGNYSRLHALVQDFEIAKFKKFVQRA